MNSVRLDAAKYPNYLSPPTSSIRLAPSNLKPIPSHTSLIPLNQRHAVLRRVLGFGEKHAVISGRLFGLADAARLKWMKIISWLVVLLWFVLYFIERGTRTLGLSDWVDWGVVVAGAD